MLAVFGSVVEQRSVARGRLTVARSDRIPCMDEYVRNIRIGALEEQFDLALFEIDLIDTPFGLPEQCRTGGISNGIRIMPAVMNILAGVVMYLDFSFSSIVDPTNNGPCLRSIAASGPGERFE